MKTMMDKIIICDETEGKSYSGAKLKQIADKFFITYVTNKNDLREAIYKKHGSD